MNEEYNLVAPDIDTLTSYLSLNALSTEKITETLFCSSSELFNELLDLKPNKENGEAKSIWIMVPRGDINAYGDFENEKANGNFGSYEEFEKRWLRDYPDEIQWYRLTIASTDDERFRYRAVSVDNNLILGADLRDGLLDKSVDFKEEYRIVLLSLLTSAAHSSMEMLRMGTYNEYVRTNLPFYQRTGVINRKDFWDYYPESRHEIYEGMDDGTLEIFREFISENEPYSVGRIKHFTANDFFNACEIAYRACGYDCDDMSPSELYLHYGDGRDEGLTGKGHGLHEGEGIDFFSAEAWDDWYYDRKRAGGHPWEICRGGNSTHISLYVQNDKKQIEFEHRTGILKDDEYIRRTESSGYYFCVAGNAWNRAVETVKIYVALRNKGFPVIISSAQAILSRFDGSDYIGIVPWRVFPKYCEEQFPETYGEILDFMHIYHDEYSVLRDCIKWIPEEEASCQ